MACLCSRVIAGFQCCPFVFFFAFPCVCSGLVLRDCLFLEGKFVSCDLCLEGQGVKGNKKGTVKVPFNIRLKPNVFNK